MIKMPERIFYGWWIVVMSVLALSTATSAFCFASLGFFMLPFNAEFGWDRAEISLSLTVFLIATALSTPVVGRLVDRYGSRKVVISSIVASGLCLAAIPIFVTELWHLSLIFLLIGVLGAGTNPVSYMPVISAWFDRYRGLAIGISVSGVGLGYAYMPVLVQYMISTFGWRSGYYALSAIVLLIILPLVFCFIKETPQEMGLEPDGMTSNSSSGTKSSRTGLEFAAVIRTREFWILATIFGGLTFALHGLLPHLVPMLMDKGIEPSTAATVASFVGLSMFVSRIVAGYLIDHFFAPHVAIVLFTMSALGMVLYVSAPPTGTLMILAAILTGFSMGAEIDLMAYLTGRYFGLRSYGSVSGVLFGVIILGNALGSFAFGLDFEHSGSYTDILIACIGVHVVTVMLMATLGKFPDWEIVKEPA